ncbi:MAG: hypothetical protein ABEH59_07875 [Halobacteriales archaeon]
MTEFEAFDTDVEVHGQTILAVVDGALSNFSKGYRESAHEALAENGIEDPEADEWYPQQAWLNTFKVIADELEPHLLDRLGEQIPPTVDWPSGISGVEQGLKAIDEAYQLNHRGGDIGYYRFEPRDEQSGEVICRNPYPCLFDRGLVRAVAQRYAPVESFVFVEEERDQCRRDGDNACTYTVYW